MTHSLHAAAALVFLCGCPPKAITNVQLSGTIFDGPDSIDGVAGANVEVLTVDGSLFDATTTDAQGRFSLAVPAAQPLFLIVGDTDVHVPTSFTVNIGTVDAQAPVGSLWARRASVLEEVQANFTGCGLADAAPTTVEGDVRLYLGDVNESDELPVVTTAKIFGDDGGGSLLGACYLDDAGNSDPAMGETGETGRYGIFGLTSGVVTLTVTYDNDDVGASIDLLIYVPEGGTVPLYPTLVPIL
jgi:hypothetical protein